MSRGSRFDKRLHRAASGQALRPVANLAPALVPNAAPRIQRTAWSARDQAEGAGRANQGTVTHTLGVGFHPRGVLTVANNNFSTGRATIRIGDYELVSGVDYLVGATANATATNISVALAGIPEVDTSVAGPDVQVIWAHVGRIRFEVQHFGAITNFTTAAVGAGGLREDGLLDYFGYDLAPPILTT